MRFRNFCWHVPRWRRRRASPSRSRRAIDRRLPLPLRFVSLRRCSARRCVLFFSRGCQLSWLSREPASRGRAANTISRYQNARLVQFLAAYACVLVLYLPPTLITRSWSIFNPHVDQNFQSKYPHGYPVNIPDYAISLSKYATDCFISFTV